MVWFGNAHLGWGHRACTAAATVVMCSVAFLVRWVWPPAVQIGTRSCAGNCIGTTARRFDSASREWVSAPTCPLRWGLRKNASTFGHCRRVFARCALASGCLQKLRLRFFAALWPTMWAHAFLAALLGMSHRAARNAPRHRPWHPMWVEHSASIGGLYLEPSANFATLPRVTFIVIW